MGEVSPQKKPGDGGGMMDGARRVPRSLKLVLVTGTVGPNNRRGGLKLKGGKILDMKG